MDSKKEKELYKLIKWQQKEIERLTRALEKMAEAMRIAASTSENNINIYQ